MRYIIYLLFKENMKNKNLPWTLYQDSRYRVVRHWANHR